MLIHSRPEVIHPHQTAPTRFVEANGIRFAYRRFGKSGGVPLSVKSPCGGIGRRARLKIEFRKECWFDSGQGTTTEFVR
jgi:hypothetical protein